MTFNEYQKKAITYDVFGGAKTTLSDPAFIAKLLGLVGETGEVADKFKKILRDKQGQLSDEDRDSIARELGDILWYVSALAHYLDMPLDQLAAINIDKLESRKTRGVIKGSGDNR